ncbi:MAG: hypothetical protein H6502_02785 [Candidatus Woesearchaeota archaeon]|nr:MAG: hypothetical protein H6502_02785 [Candidatus Woesearchaeota archaeon]
MVTIDVLSRRIRRAFRGRFKKGEIVAVLRAPDCETTLTVLVLQEWFKVTTKLTSALGPQVVYGTYAEKYAERVLRSFTCNEDLDNRGIALLQQVSREELLALARHFHLSCSPDAPTPLLDAFVGRDRTELAHAVVNFSKVIVEKKNKKN